MMDGHLVLSTSPIKTDIAVMQEIVGEPLLDVFLFVTSTDDELVMAIIGILLHDMPQDRHASNLNHRLWLELAFLTDT